MLPFSALTLLVRRRERHPVCKNPKGNCLETFADLELQKNRLVKQKPTVKNYEKCWLIGCWIHNSPGCLRYRHSWVDIDC